MKVFDIGDRVRIRGGSAERTGTIIRAFERFGNNVYTVRGIGVKNSANWFGDMDLTENILELVPEFEEGETTIISVKEGNNNE